MREAKMTEARQRLRSLADDCEARARRSRGDVRSRYHRAASDARRDAAARYMGEDGLRLALEAAASQMRFAAWLDGEVIPDDGPTSEPVECAGVAPSDQGGAPPGPPGRPAHALSAPRLAKLTGMSERGARKRIVHSFHRGLPGFYREGRRWFAERAAFAQFRMSSD